MERGGSPVEKNNMIFWEYTQIQQTSSKIRRKIQVTKGYYIYHSLYARIS
jgi:hypothetical protein